MQKLFHVPLSVLCKNIFYTILQFICIDFRTYDSIGTQHLHSGPAGRRVTNAAEYKYLNSLSRAPPFKVIAHEIEISRIKSSLSVRSPPQKASVLDAISMCVAENSAQGGVTNDSRWSRPQISKMSCEMSFISHEFLKRP